MYTDIISFINGSLMHTKLKYGYWGVYFQDTITLFLQALRSPVSNSQPRFFFCPPLIAIYSIASYTWPKHLVRPLNQTGLVAYSQNMVVYKKPAKAHISGSYHLWLYARCSWFLLVSRASMLHVQIPTQNTSNLVTTLTTVCNTACYCI